MISQGEYQIEIFPVSEFPAEFSWKGVDRDGVLASSVIKMATLDKQSTNPHLTHHVEMVGEEKITANTDQVIYWT